MQVTPLLYQIAGRGPIPGRQRLRAASAPAHIQRELAMPFMHNKNSFRPTGHAQNAYVGQVRGIISENDALVASTTGLILESQALLMHVDRLLRNPECSSYTARKDAGASWRPAAPPNRR